MWAARYSNDIDNDIARGYSFAGWGLTPAPTPHRAWQDWLEYTGDVAVADESDDPERALERARERWEERGYTVEPVVVCRDDDGEDTTTTCYLVALPGLSAQYAETAEEAVALARRDTRFRDVPLWLFPAELVDIDQDADVLGLTSGAAIVQPLGPAVAADER